MEAPTNQLEQAYRDLEILAQRNQELEQRIEMLEQTVNEHRVEKRNQDESIQGMEIELWEFTEEIGKIHGKIKEILKIEESENEDENEDEDEEWKDIHRIAENLERIKTEREEREEFIEQSYQELLKALNIEGYGETLEEHMGQLKESLIKMIDHRAGLIQLNNELKDEIEEWNNPFEDGEQIIIKESEDEEEGNTGKENEKLVTQKYKEKIMEMEKRHKVEKEELYNIIEKHENQIRNWEQESINIIHRLDLELQDGQEKIDEFKKAIAENELN
jgi:hypothetical protein